ncbi:hypothetical protein IMCC3135_25165 [Granulosicoccus antarcticus IMCC3135]|uniref:Uncharacterized protein n=1 Tax=Granulosicoccus antarcticus IMCC3135 TaxID=1192854 RepID=A0A2Z2NUB6_9GAMM|nr:hypothetical protein IMCC3135_25165 [Granulosicoccus antarcticus IMCC3135]
MVSQRLLSSLREKPELQLLAHDTDSAVRQQKLTVLHVANAIRAAWHPDYLIAWISPEPEPKVR